MHLVVLDRQYQLHHGLVQDHHNLLYQISKIKSFINRHLYKYANNFVHLDRCIQIQMPVLQ